MQSMSLKYPLIPDEKANFEVLRTTEEVINQNIKHFILTSRNTRVMNRSLGLNLRKYLGEFIDDDVLGVLSDRIREALSTYFSSHISGVTVEIDQNSIESMNITVEYYHKSDIIKSIKNKVVITFK